MLVRQLQSCKRVLVITPSKLVRTKGSEDYRNLSVLKRAEVFAEDVTPVRMNPTCAKAGFIRCRCWEAMRGYDVIVATPNGSEPAYGLIPDAA